jgi:hypothetical protein
MMMGKSEIRPKFRRMEAGEAIKNIPVTAAGTPAWSYRNSSANTPGKLPT